MKKTTKVDILRSKKYTKWVSKESKGNLVVLYDTLADNVTPIVNIFGDPEGLITLAKNLLNMANFDQENYLYLGDKESYHIHLKPKLYLNKESLEVIIGRLDRKGDGSFKSFYVPVKRRRGSQKKTKRTPG
jgi:hypothetical protein